MSRRVPLLLLLLLLPLAWALAREIPALTGRVNDTANLIPLDQRQRIEAQLAQFEQQTSNQVSVLTVDSLDGEEIADYANKVGRAWGLGQKGKDNGALLLVSKNDRKMRIEVGYGLEPVLTDLQTSIIQNQVIIPYFKKGDFGGGIEAGVTRHPEHDPGEGCPADSGGAAGRRRGGVLLAGDPRLRALRPRSVHPERHPQRELDRLPRHAADPLPPGLARRPDRGPDRGRGLARALPDPPDDPAQGYPRSAAPGGVPAAGGWGPGASAVAGEAGEAVAGEASRAAAAASAAADRQAVGDHV